MENQRIRLLMVEDDRVDAMAFERMVRAESLPYDYKCVSSVREGRDVLADQKFDLVITDYNLGDGTALDLLENADPDMAVVIVTGAGGEEIAVQAMKAGAADYLIKDMQGAYLKTLPATVEKTIKSKQTEIELKKYHEELERLVEERTVQLKEANDELVKEIEERKKAEEALREAHDRLELRVEQRTAELKRSNEHLLREIMERKRAEEGLLRSKETMEAILNATNDCAFLLDKNGVFVALNEVTAQDLDSTTDRMLGRPYFDMIPPDLASTRRERFEEVVRAGKAIRFEDGGQGRTLDHGYHPVFNPDGGVDRVAVFSREVTEQKKAHNLLVQRERLAALGEMATGVAHNFNNLLQIVIGACGLAEADLEIGDMDEVKTTLCQIVESAELGSETVKQLQDFARVRTEDPTIGGAVFDLSHTVSNAIEVSRPFWKSGAEKRGVRIELRKKLAPDCLIKGKQNELFEVIVNLIKNATEAMPEGGKLYLKTEKEDGEAILVVRDNGMGISKEQMSRVFEPFWTTKGIQGTGMGLSTCFGIVTRHGGSISVKSSEGLGAMFTVKLPLAALETSERTEQKTRTVNAGARVLVVDDQVRIAELLERGLSRHGHVVVTALSGKEGVEAFKTSQIDLVICDLGMPDMNGWQVSEAIKEICRERSVPKTPFVLCTGWAGQIDEQERISQCGVDRIVEKPLRLNSILQVMSELLDKRAQRSEGATGVV